MKKINDRFNALKKAHPDMIWILDGYVIRCIMPISYVDSGDEIVLNEARDLVIGNQRRTLAGLENTLKMLENWDWTGFDAIAYTAREGKKELEAQAEKGGAE